MRWKVKPSKPAAVFGAVFGVAILVIGITSMPFSAFLVVWVALGAGIVLFNLWAAFSPRGSVYSVEGSATEPPRRFGQSVERDG